MALGALLIPVTGHKADDVALETALGIANVFGSHLSAVCLRPDPVDIVRYVADWATPTVTGDALSIAEKQMAASTDQAAKAFDRWHKRHRLTVSEKGFTADCVTVSWQEKVGAAATVLRDIARFCDLVVMRGPGANGPVEGDAMLESVLFDARRPVLLAPDKAAEPMAGAAMIAWAGNGEETQAIAAALPLLQRMKRVEIRTVGNSADAKPEELVGYLACHGITATAETLAAKGQTKAKAILAEARRLDARLLVMGAYHRSRAREAMFGGTTRDLIAHVDIPILLAH